MNKPVTASRWFSGWRSSDRPVQDDPADLGTAFGLDMSFDDQEDPSPPPAARAQAPGWVQRLTARRRAAE